MKKPRYILDSFALLAYFQAEPGGEKVRKLLKDASAGDASVFLSVISLGEIYYIIARRRGEQTAIATVEDIFQLPADLIDAATKRVLAAAKIKARYPVSYADAFVVAAAEEFSSTIVTGDREFKEVESSASVLWL
ncbi:MAG: type II toxin-antitoxin system VapC family toxin [Desulfobacterales bacterium]|nr:type II toxin-antitoxin system VapC family toxin [Desulfobacterales bacterium]